MNSISAIKPFVTWMIVLLVMTRLLVANETMSTDELKVKINNNSTDTSTISLCLVLASRLENGHQTLPDSALVYLNKALAISEQTGYTKHLWSIFEHFIRVFTNSGNYPIALDYYFKMLNIADDEATKSKDTVELLRKHAALSSQIGNCYFGMDNNSKALEWYRKSLEKVNRLAEVDKSYPIVQKQIILYTNIGSANLSSYNFEEAKISFEKALDLCKSMKNPIVEASLYNNLGVVYKERKDFGEAFRYYDKALAIRTLLKDTAGIAQTYNNLGDAYFLTGDYRKSIEILTKALEMSQKTGVLRSQMKAANFLCLAYEKTGNFRQALDMQKLFKSLHDSIISNEQVQNASRLELQYQYEKQRKENLLQHEILMGEKERRTLVYMTLSGILLLSFAILFLLYRNLRMKNRQGKLLRESLELESKNLVLEKQNLEMDKRNLEMELDYRNKELSTHVMYLLRKNEFISSIISKLLDLKKSLENPEDDVLIKEILREMQSNLDNTLWGEFEVRFQQVHSEFYAKLLEKYPDLTPNEIKICAFMKLNMTTKDISAITFQSVKSIQVARNRLRKKMGISRDENLVAAIQQL